jgi:hypothetical protein
MPFIFPLHSSSELHSSAPHDGQVKLRGFFPSTHSIFAHLPHSTDVLIGSSKVESILNIGRPASGMSEAFGVQESSLTVDFAFSSPMKSPKISRMTPPMDRGADNDMENIELS